MARKRISDADLTAAVSAHGQAGAAKMLGVTAAAISKRLATEGRRDSAEELRRRRIDLIEEQTKKTKAHNDLVAGKIVWKENVNAMLLAHLARFNRALQQLRAVDQINGTSTADLLMQCFEGFGEEADALLTRAPAPKGAAHA